MHKEVELILCSSIVSPPVYGYIANHFPSTVSGRLGDTATSLAGFGSFVGLTVGSTALAATGGYAVSTNTLAVVILIAGGAAIFIKGPGLRKLLVGDKAVQPEAVAARSLDF